MKKFALAAFSAAALSASLSMMVVEPALALGNCGPNGHRNAYNHCVFGGQNQNWCLRHRGHVAAYGPGGSRYC